MNEQHHAPDEQQGSGAELTTTLGDRATDQDLKESKGTVLSQLGKRVKHHIWAMGSWGVVLLLTVGVVAYYGLIASPRFVSETQFVVKESGNQAELTGLASLGAVSSSSRDSLLIKAYIESRAMAEALDQKIQLRKHYMQDGVDLLSGLRTDATAEEFFEYYQSHLVVSHDETSDIIKVELQTFDPDYALLASKTLLEKSESFINAIGDKMAQEQLSYAEGEVNRAHDILKTWQFKVLDFQQKNKLYSPEQEGGAILEGVSSLQVGLIQAQAKLKELTAVMREDSAEVRAQKNLIASLEQQLKEEKAKLTQDSAGGFNKISMDFKGLLLGSELATDLYKSTLVSMESTRSQAMQKLKHLLIVEPPMLPEEAKYPRRIYNIVTWLAALLIVYFIGRLVVSIINEHKD